MLDTAVGTVSSEITVMALIMLMQMPHQDEVSYPKVSIKPVLCFVVITMLSEFLNLIVLKVFVHFVQRLLGQ